MEMYAPKIRNVQATNATTQVKTVTHPNDAGYDLDENAAKTINAQVPNALQIAKQGKVATVTNQNSAMMK